VVTTRGVSSPSELVFVGPVYVLSLPFTGDEPTVKGLVTIGNQTYYHGLQFDLGHGGMGLAAISFRVPSGAHKFSAAFGSDVNNGCSNCTFDVFLDDVRVVDRPTQGNSAPQTIPPLDVTGITTVKLSVSMPNRQFISAVLADWGDPVFN
jgi:hypothetical protein